MGGCHRRSQEGPRAGRRPIPKCRNARGVAARGGGRVWQTPDVRLLLQPPWAVARWLVQPTSVRAPHAPVPLVLHSRRTRRAWRRSTRDLARYRQCGGDGLDGEGTVGAVWWAMAAPLCCVTPSQIILFSEAGFAGKKREIWGDVPDATSWELSHTISIRVIRGGWVMYEKPRFHGRKCVLAEGDVEIDNPWTAYGQSGQPPRPFRIGSFKRVVRDYRTPEISLFAEENGQGARLRFTDSAEDTRTQVGLWGWGGVGWAPARAAMGCDDFPLFPRWLVYSKPFFDDDPYVLEPGGYPNLKAWGAKDPSICSMHPIRLVSPGCWSAVIGAPGPFPALGMTGKSISWWFLTHTSESLVSTGPAPGGTWDWEGCGTPLTLPHPQVLIYEAMGFQGRHWGSVDGVQRPHCLRLLCHSWVGYEKEGFRGHQYLLEEGQYQDWRQWGDPNQPCSVCFQVGEHNLHFVSKILLFSEPDFSGEHVAFEEDQDALPAAFIPRSCRVRGGSWILFDAKGFAGEQHVLSEGEYPTLSAMGCLSSTTIRSLKKVPVFFSEPSIFLHGLECFEGKEIELNTEVRSLQAEGFNNHVLSVRVKGGIWVLCEHGDFRGRQWLLDCTEITNWLTYSGLQHVGSLYPIRQRRIYFRIRNRELELYLSVPDDVEDMKAGQVVVSSLSEESNSVWYYEDGLIKNQVAPNMSLQVIGPAGKGAKAVLWSKNRMPRQTWSIDSQGRIHSQMFEDMILDIKGGRSYDRDHAIVWDVAEERPTQTWDIEVL
uniref:Beta/gamma crystallin 'Greek key' domain-containing protein n=1 Tax=Amazona collaria TaxID=241587 RepID=A0A8B9F0S9_9PSIT